MLLAAFNDGIDLRDRILEQAECEFHLEDLSGGLVYALDRDPAGIDSRYDSLEIVVTLHVHVYASLYGTDESLCGVRCPVMHRMEALDVHPVADHEPVEAEFIPEQVLQQPLVAVARNTVHLVVGSHHSTDLGFLDGSDEWRKVYFPQLAFGHIHGSGVQSAERFASSYQVLGTGKDVG